MQITPVILNVTGLIANIIGTIILAFSLSAYIRSMRLAIDGHELFVLSYFNKSKPLVQVTGTDTHMNRDRKISGFLSWLGIVFVVLGFALQLYSYIL